MSVLKSAVGCNDFKPEIQLTKAFTRLHLLNAEAKYRRTVRNIGFHLVTKKGFIQGSVKYPQQKKKFFQ